jgi:cyclohexadieny/prephenate dehydrogenase
VIAALTEFLKRTDPMSKPLFDRIALVGIGLIGSSLARVIRRENLPAMSPSRRAAPRR